MAFYLEGKTSVDTNDLSPKEATEMSRDIKYIGYLVLDIADSISSSGLCRVGWAAEALIVEQRGPCVACRTSSLGIVWKSRQELTPARRHSYPASPDIS